MLRSAALGAFALLVLACGKSQQPTWTHDIAPLVSEHCSNCHRDGGLVPSMSTYDQAKIQGFDMARMVGSHTMPPWPPTADGGCPSLVGDRRLPQSDIDMMNEWVSGGMPKGSGTPNIVTQKPLGDLQGISVVLGPDQPYTPSSAGDDYHCFLVDPALTQDEFITAYRVQASTGVHHFQLWEVATDEGAAQLAALDAMTPEPGFPCSSWTGVPTRFVTVWGPSDPVRIHPAGTGIRIHAGKKLVMQVHYHAGATADQTKIGLVLADHVDEEARMISLSANGFTLPARTASTSVHSDMNVPSDVKLWGVRAHMHYLGSSAEVKHSGDCLLSIPKWDPNWQLMYFYQQPIKLPMGENITLKCTYDTRTRNEDVHDGPTAADEMCFAYFYMTGLPPG